MIRIGMKNLSAVVNFKMVFGGKDNHPRTQCNKVIFLTDGKMEQYESPVLPGDDGL